MSDEVISNMAECANAQMVLASKVHMSQIRAAEKRLRETEDSSSQKEQQERKQKQKLQSKNATKVKGLNVSVGQSLFDYAESLVVENAKTRYLYYLSYNSILDFSDQIMPSQLLNYRQDVRDAIIQKFSPSNTYFTSRNILTLMKGIKKISNLHKLKQQLVVCENYVTNNLDQKNVKRIYEFVLAMLSERSWVFSKKNRSEYSEADYQFKFWAFVFETFFANNKDVCLHWGDTMSKPCKKNKLKFKLDLRLSVLGEEKEVVDGMVGEFAKKAFKSKLFHDKLKAVLAAKQHLNSFLGQVPYITTKVLRQMKFPIIQAMGFDIHVYILRLVNRGLYVVDDSFSFSFPTNMESLRDGLEEMIDGLSRLEAIMDEAKVAYETHQFDTTDAISRVSEGSDRPKKIKVKAWITNVFYNNEYDNLLEEDDEEEVEDGPKEKDEESEDEDADEDDDEEEEENEDENKGQEHS